jgi:hypothetical protein
MLSKKKDCPEKEAAMESISNKFKLPAPFIVTEGENGHKDH